MPKLGNGGHFVVAPECVKLAVCAGRYLPNRGKGASASYDGQKEMMIRTIYHFNTNPALVNKVFGGINRCNIIFIVNFVGLYM